MWNQHPERKWIWYLKKGPDHVNPIDVHTHSLKGHASIEYWGLKDGEYLLYSWKFCTITHPSTTVDFRKNRARVVDKLMLQIALKNENFTRERGMDHERRKGSVRLLMTLMMRLSLVTEKISGPGNCPLMSMPCQKRREHHYPSSLYIAWIKQTETFIFKIQNGFFIFFVCIYQGITKERIKKKESPVGEHQVGKCLHKSHSKWRTCKGHQLLQWRGQRRTRPRTGRPLPASSFFTQSQTTKKHSSVLSFSLRLSVSVSLPLSLSGWYLNLCNRVVQGDRL